MTTSITVTIMNYVYNDPKLNSDLFTDMVLQSVLLCQCCCFGYALV